MARPDQDSEAVRDEFLRDLKSDSLIRPGDQGDAFLWHVVPFRLAAWRRPLCGLIRRWFPVESPLSRPRDFRGDGRPMMCRESGACWGRAEGAMPARPAS